MKPLCAFFCLALCLCSSVFAQGPLAYVVNNNSAFLSVVDMGSRTVVGQISVGNQPSEFDIMADNRYALLSEYGANGGLRKIDLRQSPFGASVGFAPTGAGSSSIAITADSARAFVSNEATNNVSVVDLATMNIVATIPVGTTPVQVNMRPDGKFAYTVNSDSNSISVIDTGTLQVTTTVSVGIKPNQFAIQPDGKRAFIPCPGSNQVYVFDLASNSVSSTISVSGNPGLTAFSPDGTRFFVMKRAGSVDIFSISSLQLITTVLTGTNPTDMAITSDGLYAYVACQGSSQVFVVDMTSPTPRNYQSDPLTGIPSNSQPFTAAFDGNEDFVYVTLLGSNQLAVIDTSTDTIKTLLPVGTSPVAFVQLNQPWVYPGGVVNNASFAAGAPVAGGAIVSIFGEGLVAVEGYASTKPLPTSINGTQVTFNGIPAPLIFGFGLQIAAIVPSSLLGQSSARMVVSGPNGSDVSTVSLAPISAGLYSVASSGQGPGAILHSDNITLVTAAAPAHAGETVVIFATGLGQTNPAIQDGQPAPFAPLVSSATVTVTIGNVAAPGVPYAGLAPTFAGLYQVNAVVPSGLTPGPNNLVVTVTSAAGTFTSNTVTLAVQ